MMDNRIIADKPINRLRQSWCILLVFAFLAMPAVAGKLVLKIQVANKADHPQPVEIRSSLPARITTNDIISLAGLNLGYDVKGDSYYVYGTIELGPKAIAVREVELNDIWRLEDESVKTLTVRAAQMSSMLGATVHAVESSELAGRVDSGVSAILDRQAENRISLVSPIRHIQAYEANLKALQEVRQHVGRIENLVLASGMNPGETLIGEDRSAAAPNRGVHFPASFGEAVVKISVMNSSAVQARKIQVKRELPPEVTLDDVIDAGGLSIQYDSKDRLTYVYADSLEVGPQETKTFDVRIRDKWNINGPRFDFLQEKIGALRVTTSGRSSLAAVENMLGDAESRLKAAAAEKGPDALSPAYIAFYRRQSDRLDRIEQDLNRIDSALRPLDTKRGFAIPAPDKKTTWLVIYAILGFLAVLSLLFFFRWFAKS
jgi:hypothetical protein